MSEDIPVYALHQPTILNNFTEEESSEALTEAACVLIKERMQEARKPVILTLLHPIQPPINLDYCIMVNMPTVHLNINALIDRRILLDEENTINKIDIANILKNSE